MSHRFGRVVLVAIALAALPGCALLRPKPAWEAPPPPIAEGPVVPQDRVHRTTLPNGLEVLVLENHALPRLAVGVVTRRGGASEALAEAGVTSLALDVMKRGAGDRDALALARAVEEMGASLSAGADWDSTSVGVAGLSEDADQLFAILADVVLRPRFAPDEVARARELQLQGFEQEKDEPGALAGRKLQQVLYDGHRYGTSLDGSPASVKQLDAADLRAWHARLFTPGQSIVYVVGDMPFDRALAEVQKHFGAWAPGEALPRGDAPPAQTPAARRIVIIDRPDLGQAQLLFAHEGLSRRDPERIPADLANTLLGGGGFISRLMSRVRADEGLAYGISSGFSLRWQPGPFFVGTSTRSEKAGQATQIVLEELERMKTEPPSEDDLRLAKSFSAGRFVLRLETPAAIADSLVDLDVYELPADSLDTYRTRLQAVSRDDLARVASERLHPDRIAIVAVGPAATLRPQLERFGAVEVVAP